MFTKSIFDDVLVESVTAEISFENQLLLNEEVFGGVSDELDSIIEEIDVTYISQPIDELIFEELTSSEQYAADRMVGSGRDYYLDNFIDKHPNARQAFTAARSSGEKKGRIRVPIDLAPEGVAPSNRVVSHLQAHGYSVDPNSYIKGLANKEIIVGNPDKGIPYQKRTVQKRIGAILKDTNAHPDTVRSFENDPSRKSSSENQYDMIITHRAHDIYGGSTGRGWTSCANMRKGENGYDGPAARKMKQEINNYTHMVYLVKRGGDVDKDAVARISFKHHSSVNSNHETLFPESRVYGDAPSSFKAAAIGKMGELFPHSNREVYAKNSEIYNDDGKTFKFPSDMSSDHIDQSWQHLKKLGKSVDNADHQFGLIRSLVKAGDKFKSTDLNKLSKHMSEVKRLANNGDFVNAVHAFGDISRHISEKQHYGSMSYDDEPHPDSIRGLTLKVAGLFDDKNPEHMALANRVGYGRFGDHITSDLRMEIKRKALYGHCVTADDVADKINTHEAFGEYKSSKINIAEKHKLGASPIKKVAEVLSKRGNLTPDTFTRAYMSLHSMNRGGGNLYDHAVKLERDGVNGASALLDGLGKQLSDRIKNERLGDHSVAKALYYARPENRARIAEAAGISNHKEFLRPHMKTLKADDKRIADLIKASEANKQTNPQE